MSAIKLKTYSMILVTVLFSGCFGKVPTTTEYVDRPVTVYVPQKCKHNKVECKYGGSYVERVYLLRVCIRDLRESIERCE